MLVPHFSQVWFLLTPPTDALGLGALGERFPGNRRAASGVKHTHTHTHTHMSTAAQRDVLTGLCVSVHHINTHCPHYWTASVSGACLCFPLVITSASPMGHASWTGFPHIGHYHVMKECYYYLVLFAPPCIKAEGEKEDRCIPWCAVHDINCTQESFSRHPAQVTAIWKSNLHFSCSAWCTFNRDDFKMVPANNCRRRYKQCCRTEEPVQRGYWDKPWAKICMRSSHFCSFV